ncbi:hypothetical protein PQX77_009953 [Marasmius sp. AFHP31]|nr:hypothetical protein PQX77_009953 [Marasmius sp. AFHP31]
MAYSTPSAYGTELAQASELKQWLSEHFVFGVQGLAKIPIHKDIRLDDTIIQLRGWMNDLCFYKLDVFIKFVLLPAEFPPVARLKGNLYDGEITVKVNFGGIKGPVKVYLQSGWMRFGFDFTLTLGDKHSGDVRVLPAGILFPRAALGEDKKEKKEEEKAEEEKKADEEKKVDDGKLTDQDSQGTETESVTVVE